jgi:hypothetical protein
MYTTIIVQSLSTNHGPLPMNHNQETRPSGAPAVHFLNIDDQLPTTHNQLHTVFCRRATIQFFLENEVQKFNPESPPFPKKKHKTAVEHVINRHHKLTPAKRSNKSQTPKNAEPNRPRARNVLNNSTTTIPP